MRTNRSTPSRCDGFSGVSMEPIESRRLLSGSASPILSPLSSVASPTAVPVLHSTMDSSLPAPTISSPGTGTTPGPVLTTLSPTFTWTAVTGVSSMTGYQLNLYDSTAAQFTSYPISASATSYTLPSGLTAGHSYVWNLRITAMESSGAVTGHESNYLYFQTPSPASLPVPVVIGPGSSTSPGPVLTTLTPTFTWNAVTGTITGYQINLYDSTTSVFQSFQVGASATSFTLPSGDLHSGDQYVWNLRTLNGTQSGGPSTYLYFQGPATPAPVALPVPTITSPGNATSPGPLLSTDNPTFTWNAATGITGYQLNIHDNTSNKSYSFTVSATATSFTPPAGTLIAGDSFVWNLRVLNGTQSGSPSTYFYFQTPAPVALPVQIITSPGSAVPPGPSLTVANPTFRWNAVAGISGYKLNVFDTTTNKSYSFILSPTATSFAAPTGTFTLGDDFVWNLRVLNGSASGKPSTYFYFELPRSSSATKLQTKIAIATDKFAHLDSEKSELEKSLNATPLGTTKYVKLERSYQSESKEIKSVEAERAAMETELDEMT